MNPVKPTLPNNTLPVREVNIAEGQEQYLTLPAVILEDGTVIVRFQLSLEERQKLMETGDLFVQILTFNHPLQPFLFTVDEPQLIDK